MVVRMTLRLTEAVDRQVKEIAKTQNKSKNTVIVEACQSLIDKYKSKRR